MAYYRDLREYIEALERHGKLQRIKKEVDKDWEVSAVTRYLFNSVPESKRPALLFERIRGFEAPLVLGILGGSREIYALAMNTTVDGISAKWQQALANPLMPVLVDDGPCKEKVYLGDEVDLFSLPVPVWTPGHDAGPYITAGCVITKDPETGIRNVGTYRIQIKDKHHVAMWVNFHQHARKHVELNNQRDSSTPVAIVLGADPSVGLVSVSKINYGVDELAVAGGIRGEQLKIVRCETIDLEVPATAEIVLEGEIPPNSLEEEGPFGEFTGYMGAKAMSYPVEIKCITTRTNPIYHAFFSQMPPSESSCIRAIGWEEAIRTHLIKVLGLPVRDVHLLEAGGSMAYLAISMKVEKPGQVRQAIMGAWSVQPTVGKITVVVDEDIDIRDYFALNWALSFRVQPQKDVFIVDQLSAVDLDPSQAAYDIPQLDESRRVSSKMGIDATKKHEFPPVALPPRDLMEKVESQWETYGVQILP